MIKQQLIRMLQQRIFTVCSVNFKIICMGYLIFFKDILY